MTPPQSLPIAKLRWLALIPLVPAAAAATLAAFLLTRIWVGGIDLHVYFAGATIGLRDGWSHVYDLAAQQVLIRPYFQHAKGYPPGYWSPYVTPPPIAWLVAPLTRLPFSIAWGIWSGLAAAAVVSGALILAPTGRWPRTLSLLLLLAMPQAGLGAVAGNVVCLLFLAAAVGWRLALSERYFAAGLVLGLFVLKPQLALLLVPVLAACTYWRILGGLALSGGTFFATSVGSLGIDGIRQWQHLLSIVAHFHDQQSLAIPHFFPGGWLQIGAMTGIGLLAVAAARTNSSSGISVPFAAALIGSIIVSPYLNGEDFMMFTAAAVIVAQKVGSPAQQIAAWVLGASTWVVSPGSVAAPALAGVVMLVALLLAGLRGVRFGESRLEATPA